MIDDDPNDVLIIRRLCESVGLNVESFISPQDFLMQARSIESGCIVADLMMPEMTGLQLHAELKDSAQRYQSSLSLDTLMPERVEMHFGMVYSILLARASTRTTCSL